MSASLRETLPHAENAERAEGGILTVCKCVSLQVFKRAVGGGECQCQYFPGGGDLRDGRDMV